MRILYIHQNFPAQFGHLGNAFAERHGWQITFLSEKPGGWSGPIRKLQYSVPREPERVGDTSTRFTRYLKKSDAIYQTLKRNTDVRPDLVVAHSGFGTTLFLRELLKDVPIVHFCEWYYQPTGCDLEFSTSKVAPASRANIATLLADLENCTLGYCPTHWQRSKIPSTYQHKLQTIFDGVDTGFWKPPLGRPRTSRVVHGAKIPDHVKVVTYVARGFETMRGFHIFAEVASRIAALRDDVIFLCIGSDRVCYGSDLSRIKEKSFREHVSRRVNLDERRFLFPGAIPRDELVKAFGYSDLHLYLTAPFVLSWSLFNALSCGCTVLASDTQPVREVIRHGVNGLLAPFWDVDQFVETACAVLDRPGEFRESLGKAGRDTIQARYSLDVILPQMESLYRRAIDGETTLRSADNGNSSDVAQATARATIQGLKTLPRTLSRVWSLATTKDAWSKLAVLNPWPQSPPASQHTALPPNVPMPVRETSLLALLPDSVSTIMEIGAWDGHVTSWLARNFTNVKIVAVDDWTNGATGGQYNWQAAVDGVWNAFVTNCSHHRHRIVALRKEAVSAVDTLATTGLQLDVIVLQPEYDSQMNVRLLAAIQEHFPQVVVLGLRWHWPKQQRTVSHFSARHGRPLCVSGDAWRLEPSDDIRH